MLPFSLELLEFPLTYSYFLLNLVHCLFLLLKHDLSEPDFASVFSKGTLRWSYSQSQNWQVTWYSWD